MVTLYLQTLSKSYALREIQINGNIFTWRSLSGEEIRKNVSLDLGVGTQGDLDFVFCAVKAWHLTEGQSWDARI